MKTSRLKRAIRIITALQSGHRYTTGDLTRMLGITRRTVFRDLNDLRKAGVPCYYDRRTGYYAIHPKFFLPAPALSAREALGLLLLVYKARHHIHFPFKDSALWAALKIESNLPYRIKQYCSVALRNISIKADPQASMLVLDRIFTKLLEAILKRQVVNIRYYLPHERRRITTNLSPYHLMYNDHTWHVLGKSDLHKRVRPFKLNQIEELSTLDQCFIKDEKFDVREYFGRAWSMRPGGRLYNVKLKFLPEVAHNVAEVQWHSTQTVVFDDDGSAIIEFRIDGLNEIIWWILSHGDQVQVLAPRILRQKIIEIAQNTVKQNEQLLPI